MVVRFRKSGSTSREFGGHAFVDLAVTDLLQEVRQLLFLLLLDLVNDLQIGLATILT